LGIYVGVDDFYEFLGFQIPKSCTIEEFIEGGG